LLRANAVLRQLGSGVGTTPNNRKKHSVDITFA
jgi:hypothetical protein